MTFAYLDASAFVKTIVEEPESERLRNWLTGRPQRASSSLLRVDGVRAAEQHGPAAADRARRALATMFLVRLADDLLDAAREVLPGLLRSLDAIHIVSAQSLGPDLDVLVTYDERMTRAAHELGLTTAAP